MANIAASCGNKLTLATLRRMENGKLLTPGNPGNHIAIVSIPDKEFLKVERKFLHHTENVLKLSNLVVTI